MRPAVRPILQSASRVPPGTFRLQPRQRTRCSTRPGYDRIPGIACRSRIEVGKNGRDRLSQHYRAGFFQPGDGVRVFSGYEVLEQDGPIVVLSPLV